MLLNITWGRKGVKRPQRGAPGMPGIHPFLPCYLRRNEVKAESRDSRSKAFARYRNMGMPSSRDVKDNWGAALLKYCPFLQTRSMDNGNIGLA